METIFFILLEGSAVLHRAANWDFFRSVVLSLIFLLLRKSHRCQPFLAFSDF
jgi:hypothetical protein